jgi:dihydrofolate reductase
MKYISIIVAVAENNGIGKGNKLLWHISADLKRFKEITTGHTVIMGKNTFLSLPGGALKNRRNIVLSEDQNDHFEGCETVYSVNEALSRCEDDKEIFVIGGASVYRQFLPYASRLYLTQVYKTFDADTYFPEIIMEEWKEVFRQHVGDDAQNDFSYAFIVLERKN